MGALTRLNSDCTTAEDRSSISTYTVSTAPNSNASCAVCKEASAVPATPSWLLLQHGHRCSTPLVTVAMVARCVLDPKQSGSPNILSIMPLQMSLTCGVPHECTLVDFAVLHGSRASACRTGSPSGAFSPQVWQQETPIAVWALETLRPAHRFRSCGHALVRATRMCLCTSVHVCGIARACERAGALLCAHSP